MAQAVIASNDTAEALKLSTLLEPNRVRSSTAEPKIYLAHSEENHDDYFHNDRLPALTEDETNSLSHDANPLHFLKQLTRPETETESSTAQADPTESIKAQDSKPATLPGSPIYITIPIYINTSGQMPLSLLIGDQELQLQHRTMSHKKHTSTKAPNSHFNRLLEQIEPAKRRTTNRHRSQSRSKIQAPKEQNDAKLLEH